MFRSSFARREAQPLALERFGLYRSTEAIRWCRATSLARCVGYGASHTEAGGTVAHRINVVVQDDIWQLLQRIPQGDRSRTVNVALREWARNRCRLDAVAEMDRHRKASAMPAVSTEEIVRWIREDPDGGH